MKKKILLVEDNNDSLEILGLRVTNFGYEAIKAHNSKEAIACVEANPPDLILMDLDLPDVDGVKTTAILKQNPKISHIPVVALTAWMSGRFHGTYPPNINEGTHPISVKGPTQYQVVPMVF